MTILTNNEILSLTLDDIKAMSSTQLKTLENRLRRNLKKKWEADLFKNRKRKRFFPEPDYYLYRRYDCNVASGNILDAIQWAFVYDWDEVDQQALEIGQRNKKLNNACIQACNRILKRFDFRNEFEVPKFSSILRCKKSRNF